MYRIRIQLVCLFISLSGLIYSQNAVITSNKGISEEERTRLEKKFNDNSFYIDDDGVVVYTRTKNATNTKSEATSVATSDEKPVVRENNVIKNENPTIVREQVSSVKAEPKEQAISPQKEEKFLVKKREEILPKQAKKDTPIVVEEVIIEETPIVINVVPNKKQAYSVDEAFVTKDKKLTPSNRRLNMTKESGVKQVMPQPEKSIEPIIESPENRKKKKETKQKIEKRQPAFSTLEEATLAVDELLAILRREQMEMAKPEQKSSSLASRAASGGKGVARPPVSSNAVIPKLEPEVDRSQFGKEPTYYINGVMSTRQEVAAIRNRDVLSRSIRVRDTASGNPNGEIWIETKTANR